MKKEMKLGAYIESGLQDWQVIQQKNGVGAAELYGKYYKEQNREECEIWSRLASEITGESIIPWKKARILDNEKWMIILEGIPAGGPFRVETCMKNGTASSFQEALRGDMIHQVYVGDLFVIAGQSNAAGYGKDPVEDGPELGVSLFGQRGIWELASHPLNDSTGSVYEQITERMNPGRSPYLHFAKYYKRISGMPVGLIQTALGASPVSRWNPEENGDLYQNMREMIKKSFRWTDCGYALVSGLRRSCRIGNGALWKKVFSYDKIFLGRIWKNSCVCLPDRPVDRKYFGSIRPGMESDPGSTEKGDGGIGWHIPYSHAGCGTVRSDPYQFPFRTKDWGTPGQGGIVYSEKPAFSLAGAGDSRSLFARTKPEADL